MHKAIVAAVDRVEQIPGADKIQIAYVLNERVIVSKDIAPGYVGVFFQPDLQISEEFCKMNNLFRDSTKNSDTTKSGFFEDSRRVRAQPFLKVKSEGYFCGIESFAYTGDTASLKIGVQFDELNGKSICCKYISEKTRQAGEKNKEKKSKVVKPTVMNFPEHIDTEHFKYAVGKIEKGSIISIQAKRHGTSARYSHAKVKHVLPRWKEIVNKVLPVFTTESWEFVAGTRRVILGSKEKGKTGFHGSEAFRFEILENLKEFMPKGMTIYGEIVGFVNGKPIMAKHSTDAMKDKAFQKKYGKEIVYKYGCLEGTNRFIIYRITMTTDDGFITEFTQSQLVKWCNDRNLEPCLDVIEPFVYDGNSEALLEMVDGLTERKEVLCEDFTDPSHISEGVIVRVDGPGIAPQFFKSKSFAFKVMEGIAKEVEVDTEDVS